MMARECGCGVRETPHPVIDSYAREAARSEAKPGYADRIIAIMLKVAGQTGLAAIDRPVLVDPPTPTPRQTARRLFGRYIPGARLHTLTHALS